MYVGLGSLMVPEKESARLSEVIGTALRSAGLRGIVSGGGAGLHVEGDDVLTVGTVPHSWLFPRMRAAVHSCGAGTTAASLRAGLPVVGIPSPGGDQPFWARRLGRLGVSAATLPRPTLLATQLAEALTAATADRYRVATARLRDAILAEDGADHVVATVDHLLARPGTVTGN